MLLQPLLLPEALRCALGVVWFQHGLSLTPPELTPEAFACVANTTTTSTFLPPFVVHGSGPHRAKS